ncbi:MULTISPECIES: diadenosine tetraphosphate hydrolase [Arsenicicoccus]|uniref:diadenosine tetraphosphate hydrolase n=1 Tax=Arsenicicoccus TaxID=267408 RepID=UPI00257FE4EB|nr:MULTISPECIES: diadenosine tetraphosphate hydrolase [Arsenicicoccus]
MTEDWRRDRIGAALAGANPTVIARLPESFAAIGDAQFLPGYCVLLVDDPTIGQLTDLPRPRRLRFLDSMDRLGEAVSAACREHDSAFRRLNYEILGNTDGFLHAHVFARYEWEDAAHVGLPVWRYDPDAFYGETTALGPAHDSLRRSIRRHLDEQRHEDVRLDG